jgi:hypothetical protein
MQRAVTASRKAPHRRLSGSGEAGLEKAASSGVRYGIRRFFIEQEPPFDKPRLDAVKISHDYLATLVAQGKQLLER